MLYLCDSRVCVVDSQFCLTVSWRGVDRLSNFRRTILTRLNDSSSGCRPIYRTRVACLAAKQQIGDAPLGRYVIAHGPSIASLPNAAWVIYIAPDVFKIWAACSLETK